MNERVEKSLERIKTMARNIKSMCDCIINDCDDVTESDDLFIIEQQFERIERLADNGYGYTQIIYDEFDEEE